MLLEICLGVFPALTDARLAVRIPRAGLTQDVLLETDVDKRPAAADAFAVGNVEFSDLEWRCDLVLDDFDARARADDVRTDLDGLELADIQADGRIELERPATCRRLGV